MLGLATAVWLFFLAALLFAALVIVSSLFNLVRQTQDLVHRAKRASGRMRDAGDELQSLVGETEQRMEAIQGTILGGRRARAARRKGSGGSRRTLE